ncbi:tetratricopeptide repeat protein 13 isoform X8 [Sciurus carolinensis]|uniref:tetratricopeptide repeat protein 13 isoform X8 n=1 Tax=Sciurus carolinensis TaxID=30640 RepID=UPI001FB3D330|nr:tetratricopeptide repeat protein 13 isoform X8 [Sciurus carolinensis]
MQRYRQGPETAPPAPLAGRGPLRPPVPIATGALPVSGGSRLTAPEVRGVRAHARARGARPRLPLPASEVAAPRPPARRAAPALCAKMAPAGRGGGCRGGAGARAPLLLLLAALGCARATEHYSPLSLLKQELQHRQQQDAPAGGGCPQSGDWADQYTAECESSLLSFHESDCEPRGSPPCDSALPLSTEKILSQARSIAEQKRFPFATDNDSTNEELAIAYVLIGSGLYDEAIRHFSTMLQEAIESFKEALKQKVDFIDAYKSLGQAYRELGNFEAATESFQKALLLNQNHVQTLQLRGMMLYHHGSLQEALKNFKRCLQLEPYNEVCQYMKGLSHVAMGQFYEGIKAQTKVMLNDPLPGQKASPEFLKVKYLREYSRYLHAHLDTPLTEYSVDVDLPGSFKDHWAKSLPFLIEDYEEQPGLQPHIKDVLHQSFESYRPEVQELICVADRLGSLMQYETPGFLPNKRIHRAMGLAALEVMQAVQRTWTNSKVRMNGKTRLMQWRDMFDIAVKWRRVADPDQPVLWLDQMPARSLSRGFNNHINLIRGQVINMRYLEYFEKILHFIKDRILVYHGANNPKGLLEVREALEKVHKVEDLLPIMKQFNTKTKDGFTVNTKVPSLRDQGKEHEGFTITVTGDKVGNILFSVETQTTEERTQLYHAEIDALYKDLTARGKVLILSSEFGEADAVCNLILSLVYYFYNLMPLSRGSSVIAYSVIVGALMASGKEVAGKIPKGKLVDFEAMTAPGSEAFSRIAKSWMNLKSLSPSYKALPSVSEAFPTLRSMIEVLNTDSSPRCLKKL